jgi:hypothetical protein
VNRLAPETGVARRPLAGLALALLLLGAPAAAGAADPTAAGPAAPGPAAAPPLVTVPRPAPPPAAAAAPEPALPPVTVTLTPAGAVTVGDRVEAVITLRVPASRLAGEPRFPVWRDAWGEAEVREHDEPRRAGGGGAPEHGGGGGVGAGGGGVRTGGDVTRDGGATAVYTQRLVLAAFRPGKVELPPAAIAVPLRGGTVQAWTPAGLALAVRSVLPAGAAAKDLQARPPAPMRPLPLGTPFFIALAALAAAAAAGIWLLWRRERRRRAAASARQGVAPPPLAPLAELLAALDRLAAERSVVALHTGISQALRRYLGRTVGFPAPESTTTEIQRLLLARGWPAAQARPAVELLRACDLVKFARQEAPAERARERLAAARRFAEEVEDRARRAEQAAAEARARLEAAG